MAAMILQNPLPSGSAGAAPTFTMSDAPVFRPVQSKTIVPASGLVNSTNHAQPHAVENNASQHDTSENSNTNSTNMSSQTGGSNKRLNGPEVSLDIEKVKNTYYMNANRKLLSPFVSSNYSNPDAIADPTVNNMNCTLDPPIRVSLNQSCCFPGDKIEGTVFCDLSEDMPNIKPFGLSENNMLEDEIKLLVTFYGIERSFVVQESGEISCKERYVFRKTKEVGSFKNVVHRNMYNFEFCFNLPEHVPPSCNIHSCSMGKTGGLGTISYSVVATLQGTVGIVSLQGNGQIIVRDIPSHLKHHTTAAAGNLAAMRSGSRNSAKLWRYLAITANPALNKNAHKHFSTGRISIPQKSSAHISLDNDVVSNSGNIVINVDSARVKNGLVKAKRLNIKLVRRVELYTDEPHKWAKTILEKNVDIKSRIEIPLPASEMSELSASVESQLVSNKYLLQIRARPSFGVLGGNSVVCLPITIVADDCSTFLVNQCDGLCKRIRNIVPLKSSVLDIGSITDEDTASAGSSKSARGVPVELAEDQLLFVKSQAEREIVETKLIAVGIAKQQLQQAMNRALEAESELKETIKTISVEKNVKL